MASITYDGQSFLVDGRRIWLAGGTIHYARCPREQWSDRIHSAKQAGLNAITVPVVWSRHEPRPGQFDFGGDNDLRYFVDLIGRAGLYAILRIGPYIGSGYDLGGLPPWILSLRDVALRTNNTAYLEACSRYIGAVARELRDLQAIVKPIPGLGGGAGVASGAANATPTLGPILLVQNESGWISGVDEMATPYLGELNRYLRESGFEVPIINSNQLWQGVEGEIDGWTGRDNLLANLRQLGMVRPTQPRVLTEYPVCTPGVWGGPSVSESVVSPAQLNRDLVEVLCAGGQFNIEPFFGGQHLGFSGGRLARGENAFPVTQCDHSGPLDEAGRPGPLLAPLREIAMFASRFSRVLAHLDPRRQPVSLLPSSVLPAGKDLLKADGKKAKAVPGTARHALVHCTGTQGGIVFIFGDGMARDKHEPATLLLADGSTLPVYVGDQPATWCLFDVRLAGRSHLDYTNLTSFAVVGRVYVCFGLPGTPAMLSINGSPLEAVVPEPDDEPLLIDHEGILVVIACREHLPRIQIGDDAVYIGCDTLTSAGEPVLHSEKESVRRISAEGELVELKYEPPGKHKPVPPSPPPPPAPVKGKGKDAKPAGKKGKPLPPPPPEPEPVKLPSVVVQPVGKAPVAPAVAHWSTVPASDYLDGTSARYASINGPADLAALGAPYGYGWYRLRLKGEVSGRVRMGWPLGGDRLHLFLDGSPAGILGVGPGAHHHLNASFRKGEQMMVILAENLGRFDGGHALGEGKGAIGHGWVVEPLKHAKGTLVKSQPLDAGEIKGLSFGIHRGDLTDPQRISFDLPHKRKTGVVVRFKPTGHRGLIVLDDKPLRVFDGGGPTSFMLDADSLGRGNHKLQLAVLGDAAAALPALADSISFEECIEPVTAKAEWAFAKWEPPGAEAFLGGKGKGPKAGVPCWHRGEFLAQRGGRIPLYLDTAGLSKGQIYVNGRHLGRYFTATADHAAVGPQNTVLIPEPMLSPAGSPTEIVIFDEHGFSPAKSKFIYKA